MVIRSLRIGFAGLIVLAASAWAAPSILEGTVKDANGQPLKGADIRIEAKGEKFSKTVKTDAKGRYVSEPLSAGDYRVTLLVNGAAKAAINNATIKVGEPTQLNFELKKETGAQAKKPTHMVYAPAPTGSHLGGRWIEVDENGNPVGGAGADNVRTGGNALLREMQRTGGH